MATRLTAKTVAQDEGLPPSGVHTPLVLRRREAASKEGVQGSGAWPTASAATR
jgi:hypothetical protein